MKTDKIQARLEAATPGPWVADTIGQFVWQAENMSRGAIIAQMRGWGYLTGSGGLSLSDDEATAIQTANTEFIAHAPEDMAYLLDALEAETKRADEAERLLNEHIAISAGEACIKELDEMGVREWALVEIFAKERDEAQADRDRWKSRAEALERAIKPMRCSACVNKYEDFKKRPKVCTVCCDGDLWQFDEARFDANDGSVK